MRLLYRRRRIGVCGACCPGPESTTCCFGPRLFESGPVLHLIEDISLKDTTSTRLKKSEASNNCYPSLFRIVESAPQSRTKTVARPYSVLRFGSTLSSLSPSKEDCPSKIQWNDSHIGGKTDIQSQHLPSQPASHSPNPLSSKVQLPEQQLKKNTLNLPALPLLTTPNPRSMKTSDPS